MMMYRSLVIGLLGAIAMLVASQPGAAPEADAAGIEPVPALVAPADAAVVDVSRARAGADLMPLLGLAQGERVFALDGVRADGVALAAQWERSAPGAYLDVGVRDVRGEERRILVLVHP